MKDDITELSDGWKEFEGYVVFQNFNTKDWIVYEDATNKNLCHFDTREDAYEWLEKLVINKKLNKTNI